MYNLRVSGVGPVGGVDRRISPHYYPSKCSESRAEYVPLPRMTQNTQDGGGRVTTGRLLVVGSTSIYNGDKNMSTLLGPLASRQEGGRTRREGEGQGGEEVSERDISLEWWEPESTGDKILVRSYRFVFFTFSTFL